MHSCQNNLEKTYTEKKTKHTPSGYSLFTNCSFDSAEHSAKNKLDYYRDKDCMEKFCKNLRQHAIRIVNYEKKMIPLTHEESKKRKKSATCVKKDLVLIMTKSIIKSEVIVITQENLEELLIVFAI